MTSSPATSDPARTTWPSLAEPPSGPRTRVGAKVARAVFLRAMARLPVTIRLHEPDGVRVVGRGGPEMTIHRPEEFFARLGRRDLIGFGEAYLTGAWDAPDLAAFLEVPAARLSQLVPPALLRARGLVAPRIARRQRGGQADTQANIAHHYDLSNDLFAQFLDPTMTYSSAWFRTDAQGVPLVGDDLESAQHRKIEALLDLAAVGPGTRVLEIGSGWGALAIAAAGRGATVRTLTLSVEQQELARKRIAEAGLEDRISVDLLDYRLVDVAENGRYDAVVSVEMIEAVGWRHWTTYFATIERVLAPGGRVAIQAITMPHERMLASRDVATWITEYIFPGGFLPSVRALRKAAGRAGLETTQSARLGLHYAETLRQWDERFAARAAELDALGFDAMFRRVWHFYLAYCQAGFAAGYIDDHQLLFTRQEIRS
ncbi:MAG: cyclopropane-fatty-acyl-phospholipid synthase family protein [Nocardioides sp.]|uniref:class I SAM-dependent methyltransferase n=1 Tax=Nocardioides sp. TaxID=35761 RepID=UPI0039E4AD25